MIPMKSELYTSFVTSASVIAISGGTSDQAVSVTSSPSVTNAATVMMTITTKSAIRNFRFPFFFFSMFLTPFFFHTYILIRTASCLYHNKYNHQSPVNINIM